MNIDKIHQETREQMFGHSAFPVKKSHMSITSDNHERIHCLRKDWDMPRLSEIWWQNEASHV